MLLYQLLLMCARSVNRSRSGSSGSRCVSSITNIVVVVVVVGRIE